MEPVKSLLLNPTVPYAPFARSFINFGGFAVVNEYNGWEPETNAWKESCYISANLSGVMAMHTVKGPDALKLLNENSVNNFTKMSIGSACHGIMTTRKGNVIEHGMVLRLAGESFGTYAFQPYINFLANNGKYNVESLVTTIRDFIYQIAGPKSLETIENAARQDLHGLKFMRFCAAEIAGHKVRIIRMGMGGTLAYEVHGELEHSHDVYNALVESGTPFGIQKMGWLSYCCNHTENGFPQIGEHFAYPFSDEPEFMEYLRKDSFIFDPMLLPPLGSLSDDLNDYFRNPIELGWDHMIKYDHDFNGKEALRKIAAGPHREMVTLVWNAEDILDVHASYYKHGVKPYKKIIHPFDLAGSGYGNCQDRVINDRGEMIGISMHETYTLYSHDMISLCCIDPEYTKPGTEVIVVWGDKFHPIKNIRAMVARFPYLDLTRNQEYDVESIPRYIPVPS
ncbi:MAG: hypothetical protein LBS79_09085 [Tannerella sp.]|jgi:glycine cleavage system aminomethyltransferase T|nr:hypothetical protein [Tannerella sp.]